jgi:hypothetical protein
MYIYFTNVDIYTRNNILKQDAHKVVNKQHVWSMLYKFAYIFVNLIFWKIRYLEILPIITVLCGWKGNIYGALYSCFGLLKNGLSLKFIPFVFHLRQSNKTIPWKVHPCV